MSIGAKVYRLRTEKKLTQQELADRAHISQAIISKLERKARMNVHSDVLKSLATVLGCTTDYLVGMHEEDKDSEFEPAAVVCFGVNHCGSITYTTHAVRRCAAGPKCVIEDMVCHIRHSRPWPPSAAGRFAHGSAHYCRPPPRPI